jgi:hypothetical protein
MSSTGGNPDKPLEVVHKTYYLQTANKNSEQSLPNRQSVVKVSNHQPSRKTSVHDVQEATREDLNKVRFIEYIKRLFQFVYLIQTVGEIHDGLARLNGVLETMTAAASVRDEFGKIKLQLLVKITEFTYRLSNDAGRR